MTPTTGTERARDPTAPSMSTSTEAQSQILPASEARANFMEVISRVRYGRERLVVTNKGKPAAAIVTLEDLKLLQLLDDADIKEILDVKLKEKAEPVDWDEYSRRRAASLG